MRHTCTATCRCTGTGTHTVTFTFSWKVSVRNVVTARVSYRQASRIGIRELVAFHQQLRADYPEALVALGDLLAERKNYALAIPTYRDALRLRPDDASLHERLAAVLGQNGDLDAALAESREALRIAAGNPDYQRQLGKTLYRRGEFKAAADAYLNEMGITSPFFPNENCPQGDCSLLTGNPAPGLNDDGAGVEAFANFMTLLAPPPRGPITKDVAAGEVVFMSLGCASCHVPELKTGSHPVKALAHQTFFPFSDFLLHDMANLGDGIEQGRATGPGMRTAPLWGLREIKRFLHDGRATTIDQAIRAHDGQAREFIRSKRTYIIAPE